MTSTVELRDGRTLAFAERGDPDGRPVVHCHANPAGRLEAWGADQLAGRGVRIITPDRPGIGRSSPQPGRTVADWAADVRDLADHLGLERFALTGLSLGGVYALACAQALGDRVSAVGITGAPGRLTDRAVVNELGIKHFVNLARRAPWAMGTLYGVLARIARRNPRRAHKLFWSDASPADRAVVDRPDAADRFMQMFLAASEQTVKGLVEDMRVPQRDWGFEAREVSVPVHIWHGTADAVVPIQQAERTAQELPDARLVRCEGEGHFLIEDRLGEILDAVTPVA